MCPLSPTRVYDDKGDERNDRSNTKRLCVRGFAWRRTVGLLLTMLPLLSALCACSGRVHAETDGDGLNNPGLTEADGQEMKTLTEPTLSLTPTVPAAWDDIAQLSAYDKGTASLGYLRLFS